LFFRGKNGLAATWLDARKIQFATTIFLDIGFLRFGEVTNNSAEQSNSALKNARQRAIIDLIQALSRRNAEQFLDR